MAKSAPKRLIIKEMIEAGDATKANLIEELGISKASLATNFTYLRLMGFYPVADEEGILSFVSEAEWNTIQEAKADKTFTKKNVSKKTPQEKWYAAIKKVKRCMKAVESANNNYKADSENEDLLDLKVQRADIELKIADIERDNLIAAHDEIDRDEETAPVEITEDVEETNETTEDVV